jgi:hypothetical protein
MPSWAFFPGIVLIGLSIALTFAAVFGAMIRRRRPNVWITLLAARLRFIGMGVLFIIPGVAGIISGLVTRFNPGLFGVAIFMAAMGGVYFYAASDPIFSKGGQPFAWPRLRRGDESEGNDHGASGPTGQ